MLGRRQFLQSAAISAATDPVPTATLGKTGLRVPRLVVGGYHMNVQGEKVATAIIHRALACGLRHNVMLMTKCEIYSRQATIQLL